MIHHSKLWHDLLVFIGTQNVPLLSQSALCARLGNKTRVPLTKSRFKPKSVRIDGPKSVQMMFAEQDSLCTRSQVFLAKISWCESTFKLVILMPKLCHVYLGSIGTRNVLLVDQPALCAHSAGWSTNGTFRVSINPR